MGYFERIHLMLGLGGADSCSESSVTDGKLSSSCDEFRLLLVVVLSPTEVLLSSPMTVLTAPAGFLPLRPYFRRVIVH